MHSGRACQFHGCNAVRWRLSVGHWLILVVVRELLRPSALDILLAHNFWAHSPHSWWRLSFSAYVVKALVCVYSTIWGQSFCSYCYGVCHTESILPCPMLFVTIGVFVTGFVPCKRNPRNSEETREWKLSVQWACCGFEGLCLVFLDGAWRFLVGYLISQLDDLRL